MAKDNASNIEELEKKEAELKAKEEEFAKREAELEAELKAKEEEFAKREAELEAELESRKGKIPTKIVNYEEGTDPEELVDLFVMRIPGEDRDLLITVNGETCLIQKGINIKVKRKFAEVVENSIEQDNKALDFIEQLKETYND